MEFKFHVSRSDKNSFILSFKPEECMNKWRTTGNTIWSNTSKEVSILEIGICVSDLDNNDNTENLSLVQKLSLDLDKNLYVVYDISTWNESTDGLIYTDPSFLNCLCQNLSLFLYYFVNESNKIEINGNLLQEIDYSELNLQKNGRVSFKALKLSEFFSKLPRDQLKFYYLIIKLYI